MDKLTCLNKKDIIRINQEIGENGSFQNESSLDFALSHVRLKKGWLYEVSYFLRSLLVDHAFQDGNKRTALVIMIIYCEDNHLEFDKEYLVRTIWTIAKKNMGDINRIRRMMKGGIVY